MNIFHYWNEVIHEAILRTYHFVISPEGQRIRDRITVDISKDPGHGHLATNVALVLPTLLGKKQSPRDIAAALCKYLVKNPAVLKTEIAGPGFINLTLTDAYWNGVLKDVMVMHAVRPHTYQVEVDASAPKKAVNIEYVSCNPTGPMHIGQSRGAIVGDVLAKLYAAMGHTVVKEFYCNDTGNQVQALARSVYKRYCEVLGAAYDHEVEYPGDYLQPVALGLVDREGSKWLHRPESEWLEIFRAYAVECMMKNIRSDLAKLNIQHDVYTSEKSLIDQGMVHQTLQQMETSGLLYQGVLEKPKGHKDEDWEPREQLLFHATDFGDDCDRALMKSDGSYTYFASDIAYHADKIQRGAQILVNVWGADHAGYIKRMQSAVKAISNSKRELKVIICQLIKFIKDGATVKMSKRAGTFVTVDDVLSEVSKDIVRFAMLTRRNDAPLDFDFAKVVEESRENPVFYVHYAYARICSVLRHAEATFGPLMQNLVYGAIYNMIHVKEHSYHFDAEDYAIIRLLSLWPRTVELAAHLCEPHRVAFYLYDLAAAFHGLWTKGKEDLDLRFIHADNWEKTESRMVLLKGIQAIFLWGFDIIGITAVEELR